MKKTAEILWFKGKEIKTPDELAMFLKVLRADEGSGEVTAAEADKFRGEILPHLDSSTDKPIRNLKRLNQKLAATWKKLSRKG